MIAVKLVHSVSIPTNNPASIAFHKDGILVADIESGKIMLLNYRTGENISETKSVVRRPQTISWDGEYLWEYDEETGDLYKNRLGDGGVFRFGSVPGINSPYYGFTYHKKTLWLLTPDQPEFTVSNNFISVIDFPRSIQTETFEAPTHSCRGLSHDGSYLWTLDVEGREVFALDDRTGEIITSYELPDCISPSSIIVTENKIWTLDIQKNQLLTYELDRNAVMSTSGGRRSKVDLVYTFVNNGPGKILDYELYDSLPDDYVNQKIIKPPKITPTPDAILVSQWDETDGKVILHKLKDIGPTQEKQITISFEIDTIKVKYHIYPHKTGTLDDIPGEIRKNYLFTELMKSKDHELKEAVDRAQLLFQTGEKEIREKVHEILHEEKNPFWIAKKIYNFIIDNIKYVLPYRSINSRKILKQGKGSCGNHATIFIALCQIAGLPARSIVGFALWKDDSRLGYLDHEIPEVYFPNYGWIPMDTSRFMSLPIYGTHPLTKFHSFGTLSDRLFINGFGRDLRSPFARKRHREERMCRTDGPCNPILRFFMRWHSQQIATWK
jgi:hypothetical protein